MAKQDFLPNFRIARNLFAHQRVETDGSNPDQAALERRLGRAAVWLTPKSVKGFNADDFPELGVDRQRELQAAVQDFLEVAKVVPPKEPATPEQLSKGKAAFAKWRIADHGDVLRFTIWDELEFDPARLQMIEDLIANDPLARERLLGSP